MNNQFRCYQELCLQWTLTRSLHRAIDTLLLVSIEPNGENSMLTIILLPVLTNLVFISLQLRFCHSSFLVHGPANDLPLPPLHCHLEPECHKSSFFTTTRFRGFTVFQLLPSRRVLVHLRAGSGFRYDLRSSFSYLDSGNAGRLTKGQILKKHCIP